MILLTPPTLTKPSKTLFRKGFPKSTSTSRCGDSTVASKCACGILCTTKTTCNSNSKVEYKTTTTTTTTKVLIQIVLVRSGLLRGASERAKQASEDRDLDAKAKLPASATDGRKWTFGGEEEEEDGAHGRTRTGMSGESEELFERPRVPRRQNEGVFYLDRRILFNTWRLPIGLLSHSIQSLASCVDACPVPSCQLAVCDYWYPDISPSDSLPLFKLLSPPGPQISGSGFQV